MLTKTAPLKHWLLRDRVREAPSQLAEPTPLLLPQRPTEI